jgi:hypothetical protein
MVGLFYFLPAVRHVKRDERAKDTGGRQSYKATKTDAEDGSDERTLAFPQAYDPANDPR